DPAKRARPGEGRSARQGVLGPARRARPGEGPPRASLLAHPAPLGELVLDPAQRALETRGVVLLLGDLRVVDDGPHVRHVDAGLALLQKGSEPRTDQSFEGVGRVGSALLAYGLQPLPEELRGDLRGGDGLGVARDGDVFHGASHRVEDPRAQSSGARVPGGCGRLPCRISGPPAVPSSLPWRRGPAASQWDGRLLPTGRSLTSPGLVPVAADRLGPSSSLPASAAFLSPSPRWRLRDLALLFDLAFLVHRPAVPLPPPACHPIAVRHAAHPPRPGRADRGATGADRRRSDPPRPPAGAADRPDRAR